MRHSPKDSPMNLDTHLNTIGLPATPAVAASCGAGVLQQLRDWVPIRTLAARHRAAVRAHLLGLDADDRQRRFGHTVSDERLQAYAAQLDFEHDQIFGTFDRRLRLVALGHLALGADEGTGSASGHGELGLSVLASARGRGLGTRLFQHAVMHARNRGVHTLHIQLARDNAPMLAIVQRAGARIEHDGSEALAVLPLAGETLGSQIGELLGERAAALDFRLKVQTLRAPTPSPGACSPTHIPPFD
jgi:GNAT superfamily N-acetyltransferase